MARNSEKSKAYLYALAAIGLWATFAFLALQVPRVPPFLLVASSLLIGSVCGLPWIREWRVSWPTLAMGIYGLFGFHFFIFLALRNAPPVEANLINYLWPLLIVVLSPVFLPGYKLAGRHVLAVALGFCGTLLIVTGGRFEIKSEGMLGYTFAAASAFIWASYSLLSKRVRIFSTGAIGLFCFISGLLSLLCHVALEPVYKISSEEYLPILLLGLGPMGVAFFLWDKALKVGDPRTIGSLSYLTPMLSSLILISTGSGQFTWESFIAMILILTGASIGALSKKHNARR